MRTLFALAFHVISVPLHTQTSSQALAAANGRLSVEFSDLTSIRELADGRVLLFDRREERLVVADFATGTVRDVARKGQGPAEFEFIAAMLPLAGDTTIAADLSRRWLILVGDSVVRKLLPEHPALQRIGLGVLGADRSGRVLSRVFGARQDSASIILVDRTSGSTDTIGRLANEQRRGPVTPGTTSAGPAMRLGRIPMSASESSLLFTDGWTAIVRLDPYRVDWRAPNGSWALGRPLPVRRVRMSAAEKDAYLRRHPGLRNATDWPDELPPFQNPVTLLGSPDGVLLVHRLPTLSEPGTRYDVIDRAGTRRAQLVLSSNERILGFGPRSVYVIETDNDGIQRLRRHAWVPSTRP